MNLFENTGGPLRAEQRRTPSLSTIGRVTVGALFLLILTANGHGAALSAEVAGWLSAQTNIHTWSAEFTQTRTLKSLTQPLKAAGHVWFASPNRFRWELGDPPQTIAVREGQELRVIYPKLKRVERFPLTPEGAGQWRDALALLEAGFPRSQSELEKQFLVVSEKTPGTICELELQPKSKAARRMMPRITIIFDMTSYSLKATELQFADGSTLRNEFANQVLNPTVDPKTFSPEIPTDYKVTEPLKQ